MIVVKIGPLPFFRGSKGIESPFSLLDRTDRKENHSLLLQLPLQALDLQQALFSLIWRHIKEHGRELGLQMVQRLFLVLRQ